MLFTSFLSHGRKLLRTLSPQLTTPRYLSTVTTTTTTTNFVVKSHVSPPALPSLRPLNSNISELMRHGLVKNAQNLFEEMPHRNTVTWNAMIRGYFLNGLPENALQMFDEMPDRDLFSYNTVVAGLMQRGDVDGAKRVFDGMRVRDVVTWNSMLSGFVRNGMVTEAVEVFDEMPVKDVVSWNLVIGGLVRCGEMDSARGYFSQMSSRDFASWTIMISGLASSGRIIEARELFDEMPSRDAQARAAMIVGYIENGFVEIAEALFHKLPDLDFDSWNGLVNGLAKRGRVNDALKLFVEMPEKSRKSWNSISLELVINRLVGEAHAILEKSPYSDAVSWTNLIIGYFEIGDAQSAIHLFETIRIRDATVYNVTIFGLGENDFGEKGIKIFIRMKESESNPDEATLTSVLTICSNLPSLQLGKQTHSLATKSGLSSFVAVNNAMITMYSKSGDMGSAWLEFSSMTVREIVSWNSIISGFARHGDSSKALEIFERMRSEENFEPNDITFVGVLSACSHAGLVDLGRHFFDLMRREYLIRPTSEHYTCLVDLVGRFGLIDEAMRLLGQMREEKVKVPSSVWGALLGACRIHRNIEVAEIAWERILETEPWNSGSYLILAETYLSVGRKKEAEIVWSKMRNSGVKKQPGCSWIEVNNISHVFLSGDRSHSEFVRVRFVLELLRIEMKTM